MSKDLCSVDPVSLTFDTSRISHKFPHNFVEPFCRDNQPSNNKYMVTMFEDNHTQLHSNHNTSHNNIYRRRRCPLKGGQCA